MRVIASIQLVATEEGGRRGALPPTVFGCPVFFEDVPALLAQGYACRIQLDEHGPSISPGGEAAQVALTFLSPDEVMPHMRPGVRFKLWEGKMIGSGVVLGVESVRALFGDHWQGASCVDWEIEQPTAEDFDRAFDRLDAATCTLLTVGETPSKFLMIGGGAGQYVVCATFDNETFFNLVGAPAGSEVVFLNCGGQVGDFRPSQIASVEAARAAGAVFLRTGELAPELRWEQDGP